MNRMEFNVNMKLLINLKQESYYIWSGGMNLAITFAYGAVISGFLLYIVTMKLIKQIINKHDDTGPLTFLGAVLLGFIVFSIITLY